MAHQVVQVKIGSVNDRVITGVIQGVIPPKQSQFALCKKLTKSVREQLLDELRLERGYMVDLEIVPQGHKSGNRHTILGFAY